MATRANSSTKLSISKIAEALGVSKATVSWVLSGQGDAKRISCATQKKIKDYAEDHNYRPNMLARSLSLGVTKTVGLLISSLADPFYSSIAKSVVEEAEKYGYTVMISTSESDHDREAALVDSLNRRRVDGFIVTPTEGAAWLDEYVAGGGNLILVDRPVPGSSIPYVGVDNEQSSYRLVSHLIGKGCRKIAIFTTAHNLVNMQARHEGYLRALKDAGIEPDEKLIRNVASAADQQMIEAELSSLLADVPDLDGIFFTTHVLVLPTYVYFSKVDKMDDGGNRWACIHSLPEFEILLPKMSIAQMDISRVGASAMDMLVAQIEQGITPTESKYIIECEMKLR